MKFYKNYLKLWTNANMFANFKKPLSQFIKIKLYLNHCYDNLMKSPSNFT
jgi:hypothetical protein